MAKLDLNALPISMFTFDKARNMLIGEMSMVERNIGRLYDDAMDVGLEIQGKYQKVRYYYTGENIYSDGEVQAMILEAEGGSKSHMLPVLHVLNT